MAGYLGVEDDDDQVIEGPPIPAGRNPDQPVAGPVAVPMPAAAPTPPPTSPVLQGPPFPQRTQHTAAAAPPAPAPSAPAPVLPPAAPLPVRQAAPNPETLVPRAQIAPPPPPPLESVPATPEPVLERTAAPPVAATVVELADRAQPPAALPVDPATDGQLNASQRLPARPDEITDADVE